MALWPMLLSQASQMAWGVAGMVSATVNS